MEYSWVSVNPTTLSIEVQSRKFVEINQAVRFKLLPCPSKLCPLSLSDYVQLAGTKSLCLEVHAITGVPPALNFIKLWGQEHVKITKGASTFRNPK
jgi:hypothetical protein